MKLKLNQIYLGDNLEIMKTFSSKSIDLIYADPPFFSQRNYGDFNDIWETRQHYLDFMILRLQEMHRLLKDTGSIYLHCDPSCSHYLKIEMDKIWGDENFRNEIVWGYRTGGVSKKQWPRKHDIIFFYAKSNKWTHNPLQERIFYEKSFFNSKQDNKGRFYEDVYIRDVWEDLKPLLNLNSERLGYPTQKPLALLKRIIEVSSNKNDLVLDPFCGSGTTLEAAKKLGRNYIGIDINKKAIDISKERI